MGSYWFTLVLGCTAAVCAVVAIGYRIARRRAAMHQVVRRRNGQ